MDGWFLHARTWLPACFALPQRRRCISRATGSNVRALSLLLLPALAGYSVRLLDAPPALSPVTPACCVPNTLMAFCWFSSVLRRPASSAFYLHDGPLQPGALRIQFMEWTTRHGPMWTPEDRGRLQWFVPTHAFRRLSRTGLPFPHRHSTVLLDATPPPAFPTPPRSATTIHSGAVRGTRCGHLCAAMPRRVGCVW